MTRLPSRLLWPALLVASVAARAEPDADTLIAGLARDVPASIRFAEARFSSLLREPLIVAGVLEYAGPDALTRKVESPYRETTTIGAESARVERDGKPARSFALRRAPELQELYRALGALLAGDAGGVGRHFEVAVAGTDDSWTLELTPFAPAGRRVERIRVDGGGSEPRCFSIVNTEGGTSVMLLGPAAEPPLSRDATLESLQRRCRAE
jgi:hypothetical protein